LVPFVPLVTVALDPSGHVILAPPAVCTTEHADVFVPLLMVALVPSEHVIFAPVLVCATVQDEPSVPFAPSALLVPLLHAMRMNAPSPTKANFICSPFSVGLSLQPS